MLQGWLLFLLCTFSRVISSTFHPYYDNLQIYTSSPRLLTWTSGQYRKLFIGHLHLEISDTTKPCVQTQHFTPPHIHTQLQNQFFFCVPILAKGIMNWTYVFLPKFSCWSLIPIMMAFGGGAPGGNLVWMRSCGWVPHSGVGALVRGWRAQSSVSCEDSVRKMVTGKAGNEFSPDTKSVSALILDLKTPELWEINICCLSHQVYSIFVITAPTDKNNQSTLLPKWETQGSSLTLSCLSC